MAVPLNPVIILGGQSNTQGHDATSPADGATFAAANLGPIANVRWAYSDSVNGESTSCATSLNMPVGVPAHFGPEQKMAVDLLAAGWTNLTVLKWTHNGTLITAFQPGGADYYRLERVLTMGRPRAYPMTPFFIWGQGEAEAKVGSGGSEALANAWGARHEELYNTVTARVGRALVGGRMLFRICSQLHISNQAVAIPWLANVRAQQVAQAALGGHMFDTDDIPLQAADELHFTAAGMHTLGARYAAHLISLYA